MDDRSQTRRPVTVLYVEDNEDHAVLAMRSLQEHQVENRICHVSDGEQALDFLFRRGDFSDEELSPRPDVVLLDLRLPRVDGLEVLREIKESENLHRIPVVILTTSEAETDIAKAYDLHANAYLVKPVGFSQFVDLMKDLGLFWLGWNKSPT